MHPIVNQAILCAIVLIPDAGTPVKLYQPGVGSEPETAVIGRQSGDRSGETVLRGRVAFELPGNSIESQNPTAVSEPDDLPIGIYPADTEAEIAERFGELGPVDIGTAEDEDVFSNLRIGERSSGLSEAVTNPQATRPTKGCKHFLGYLQTHRLGVEIPDECAICPNIIKCSSHQ